MQYFKTAQLCFKSIIDQFDILAISEHSLFEEQLGILKTATDGTYNYHAVSASDNPRIISGEQAHGGVALLWKYSINDFVTPIKSIQSDRIVGITLYNVCSVHWGMFSTSGVFSTSGDTMSTSEGYHEYIGGIS